MRSFFISACIWILIATGSFLLVSGGMDYWESRKGQTDVASDWEAGSPSPSAESQTAKSFSGTVARVAPPAAGGAVAKLTIPRLNTVLYVVEGADNRDLKRGPGHLAGTVLPGEDGNCVIAGHRDTHFRVLKDIRDGDDVILERNGLRFRYTVDNTKIVKPSNIADLKPTDKPVLNLVTCYPFYYMGSAPKRFIVHADLQTAPLQASR